MTDYYGIHEVNVWYLTDWFWKLIKSTATSDLCFVRLCNRGGGGGGGERERENPVALPGEINRS